ncbi:protoheme IX farnesyltransferase [Coprinellus micaceus]|uniref:Protoheme IX farnesyltransferase, mitochondrial n=1 Tax=Coprinellus micaceus TaxID=71717 RepID=A0A4Y7TKG0_COPMI|nr:protoheme IX farnesyltransferase [Coprinellus micaceus]
MTAGGKSRSLNCFPLLLLGARRLSSSPVAPSNAFFLHNIQWLPPGYEGTKYRPASLQRDVHPALANPAPPLKAFKEIDTLNSKRLLKVYAQLSKARLTVLVMLTSMSAVALSPLPTTVPILLSTAIGTALCSASANTLNQLQEVPFDAQMARTRSRPLVRRAITPLHGSAVAVVAGIAGPALLWYMVNPVTALLGAGDIVLYAGVYTWMKRKSIYNTWVGSVVGALPPLMGWTACGGKLLPSPDYPIHTFLPDFLTANTHPTRHLSGRQPAFPHFNALSYLVRDSYAQAGYTMLSVIDPAKNALVSLRHAALLVPICSILFPLSGLTTWAFALTSLVPNLICVRSAWRFWKYGGEKHARSTFQHSLWYLPVVMGLAMLHKQGMDWLNWLGIVNDEEEKEQAVVVPQ